MDIDPIARVEDIVGSQGLVVTHWPGQARSKPFAPSASIREQWADGKDLPFYDHPTLVEAIDYCLEHHLVEPAREFDMVKLIVIPS